MRTIPLIQFGLGGVGRAVVERVLAARAEFAWRFGIRLDYVAVCDSGGAVIDASGLSDDDLQRLLAAKNNGLGLDEIEGGHQHNGLAEIVNAAGVTNAIVLDLTASANTTPVLELALDRGYSVALANKKPLAAAYATFRKLIDSRRVRYEATVGAGVPVIATLRDALIGAYDPVHRIEGCFSGTLGYLTTGLQAGESFSSLVREAKARGYTEPDPREDLGGMDVARKALILARTLGWPLELNQVAVESLFPIELAEGTVDDFLGSFPALDAEYSARVAAAQAEGNTLRYVAALTNGDVRVGLQAVPLASPLGRLQGTDNLIAFHTNVYSPNPLVLQGRGAGVHGTAAGVMADIVALSQ